MKKPHKTLIKLGDTGGITGIKFDYVQVGVDTCETMVTLETDRGLIKGKWETYKEFLELKACYRTVCEIKHHYRKELDEWKAFEKQNKKELAEYERLKRKFG